VNIGAINEQELQRVCVDKIYEPVIMSWSVNSKTDIGYSIMSYEVQLLELFL
jgi:hypothetical protein